MNPEIIRKLLDEIASGRVSAETAFEQLKHLPSESLGFATLDHHRSLRQGFPEVIFCQGKTEAQVLEIFQRMEASHTPTLATRVTPPLAEKIRERFDGADHNRLGRTVVLNRQPLPQPSSAIALITAGTSDIPVAEEAKVTAELFGHAVTPFYDIGVAGIHRLTSQIRQIGKTDLVIVVAGMDGALASVVGGLVPHPVIAVPTSTGYGTSFGGLSALLAMLNSCAAGLAVVNIDNGFGAASLAHRILSHRR